MIRFLSKLTQQLLYNLKFENNEHVYNNLLHKRYFTLQEYVFNKIMQGIINMMRQKLKMALLLLSLVIPTILYAEHVEDNKTIIINDLQENINDLLLSKDSKYLDEYIFGDCIHHFLNNNDNGEKMSKNIILEKIPKIFNNKFKVEINQLIYNKNIYIYDEGEANTLMNSSNLQGMANIIVNDDKQDYQFSWIYWFVKYKHEKHWVFTGLTCAG